MIIRRMKQLLRCKTWAGTHCLDLMLTQKAIWGSKIGENAHFWGVFKLRGAVKNFWDVESHQTKYLKSSPCTGLSIGITCMTTRHVKQFLIEKIFPPPPTKMLCLELGSLNFKVRIWNSLIFSFFVKRFNFKTHQEIFGRSYHNDVGI